MLCRTAKKAKLFNEYEINCCVISEKVEQRHSNSAEDVAQTDRLGALRNEINYLKTIFFYKYRVR